MKKSNFSISGQILLLHKRKIVTGSIHISEGKIIAIEEHETEEKSLIMPGFIDAHIHIESSMLLPSSFSEIALSHGTLATISDPHEIANVLGVSGVEFMIENARQTDMKFHFGAPSCVPATNFETAGAHIGPNETEDLLRMKEISYLAEMMNYPGVINNDSEVMAKIAIAKRLNKPVDGHAPGLRGKDAEAYFNAGISTDHECFSYDEAKEKAAMGVNILIREGSAAKNYEALIPLMGEVPEKIMFCSDDKHPHELVTGHIDEIVKRAIADGYDFWDVLHAACSNPIDHYKMDLGRLNVGDPADFIVVNDPKEFKVMEAYIEGKRVFPLREDKKLNSADLPNRFERKAIKAEELTWYGVKGDYRCIEILDGQLITKEKVMQAETDQNGALLCDADNDLLKMVLFSRYDNSPAAFSYTSGFGLKNAAIASSVAHDSHNIISVGDNDEDLLLAINAVIKEKGGIAISRNGECQVLPLPVAGLMSDKKAQVVAEKYLKLHKSSLQCGSKLHDPFMSLSFCALLVIPELKLSDKGLFNAVNFIFVEPKL